MILVLTLVLSFPLYEPNNTATFQNQISNLDVNDKHSLIIETTQKLSDLTYLNVGNFDREIEMLDDFVNLRRSIHRIAKKWMEMANLLCENSYVRTC
tara:strand:- start:273 stop:563 length:291 start_codon:yes stop_codon:yes gene_type:complete